jgi:hypothetical protein
LKVKDMDQPQKAVSTTTSDSGRPGSPLGRGLGELSQVFSSYRTTESKPVEQVRRRIAENAAPPSAPSPEKTRPVSLFRNALVTKAQLIALLKENHGTLEDGLRVIDVSLPCHPYGEIDLVGLDSHNQLVVIDCETLFDDALLVRGLAHLDWLSHNAQNVRRMHSGLTINTPDRPRLFLLAPRFSAAVMGAARHLTGIPVLWIRYQALETGSGTGIFFDPLNLD